MYDSHYNFIRKNLDAENLFTDADSLIYKIKSKHVYEEFYKDKHLFDLSNYPKDSKLFYPVNEKVIGKMKDEYDGKPINDCNWTRTHNHLVHKRTLNHLAKLAK